MEKIDLTETNKYLRIFKQIEGEKAVLSIDKFIELSKKKLLRDDLVLKYSWAVPNKKLLNNNKSCKSAKYLPYKVLPI